MAPREFGNLRPLAAILGALALASCGGSVGESASGPTAIDVPAVASQLRPADVQLGDLDLEGRELGEGEVVWSDDDPDGLSASEQGKVLLCHKGQMSLWVPRSAVTGHQRHGDTLGQCGTTPPPAPTCPCFSKADIEAAVAGCGSVKALCPAAFSLGLFCAPAGSTGSVATLGYWEAVVGQGSCRRTVPDPSTGEPATQIRSVDADQFEACRTAITSSSPYPSSCPQ
jgi:hypothetical protein